MPFPCHHRHHHLRVSAISPAPVQGASWWRLGTCLQGSPSSNEGGSLDICVGARKASLPLDKGFGSEVVAGVVGLKGPGESEKVSWVKDSNRGIHWALLPQSTFR